MLVQICLLHCALLSLLPQFLELLTGLPVIPPQLLGPWILMQDFGCLLLWS